MSREDIHKLMGGYATGTLTPEEQQALFEAALNDQELFDALAREQPLCDLLRDPAAKAQVLAALDERPTRWYQGWAWWRPAASIVAMAGLATVAAVMVRDARRAARTPERVMVAQVRPPAEPTAAPAGAAQLDRPAEAAKRAKTSAAPAPERIAAVPQNGPASPAMPANKQLEAGNPLGAIGGGGGGSRGPGGGVAGGVVGGVVGGIMPPAQPAPAPPAPAPKAELQAASDNLAGSADASARELFYQNFAAPRAAPQSFAPKEAKDAEKAAAPKPVFATARLAKGARDVQERSPTNPGIRYRILEQISSAGQASATTLRVEFTPNDNGMLTVVSSGRTLFSHPVTRLQTYITEPLGTSDRELSVVFSRTAPLAVTGAAALETRNNIVRRSEEADGIYVTGEPSSPELRFTIRLNDR